MARDLLCIPLAGVGVERTFNFARDMCSYRRGQLHPETIRSLLLVYHAQIRESRLDEAQRSLSSTIDINNMMEEEIEAEIQDQEDEMDLRKNRIDDWDQDCYISDIEAGENIPSRTARMQLRTDYIARKTRRQNPRPQSQALSTFDRSRREEHARIAREQEQRDRENPGIYDPPMSDENEDDYYGLPGIDSSGEDEQEQVLPLYSRRRRAEDIVDNFVSRKTQRRE
jgi:hypothetical protein